MDEKLTNAEQMELAECEAAIKHILGAFYEEGGALQKIRDKRLYRATHATFAEYCQERWEMARAYAYRLIQSAQVIETLSKLSPMGDIPASERQARELAGLAPDELRKVWQKVIKTAPDGHITAAHIRETRESLFGSRHNPVQEQLFTLEQYREAIKDHVDAANHSHHDREHHCRQAKRLRDEAFKKFAVQIELPFDFEEDK